MTATSILMISEIFYRSGLDIQYVKLFINCVTDYLTLQLIAIFYPVNVFFNFQITWVGTWARHGAISPKRRNHEILNWWKNAFRLKLHITDLHVDQKPELMRGLIYWLYSSDYVKVSDYLQYWRRRHETTTTMALISTWLK